MVFRVTVSPRLVRQSLAAALILAALAPAASQAGPMGFKDNWMTMGDFGPNWREAFINYAITPRDAFGAGALYMRSDDKTLSRSEAELNYTRLVQRWNMPHAQANLWFVAGVGTIRGNDFSGTRTAFTPGVQFDFETTRVYLAAQARAYRASGVNHDYGSLRAGFSFYEVSYDETQPWFILEARRMRGLSDKTEVTPMLRLINKSYFVELGVNNSHLARFNLMYIF
jgi:hypothetical protein